MLFTSNSPMGALYFSAAARSKACTLFSEMCPIAASVEKILLQSRKHVSASYSACVIVTPPSDMTVYFRVWDSQWLGRRVIRKLSFTKFPYKTKVHRNLTSPAHNYGLLRLDYDEIFKVSLLIRKNLLESAKRL